MKMIFALLSLFTSSAMAVTMVQQNLIPAASQNEVNAGLGLTVTKAELSDGVDMDRKGLSLTASYYYGLLPNQAIGLEIGSDMIDTEYDRSPNQTVKNRGLNDINFRYKANFDLGTPTLFLSAGFGITPNDKTLKSDSSSNDAEFNNASGANSLAALVGLVIPHNTFNYGFSAGYRYQLDGKYKSESSQNTTADLKGGSSYSLAVFSEFQNDFHPNISLNYDHGYSAKATVSSGSDIFTQYGSEKLALKGTLRIAVNEHVELIPSVGLVTYLNKSELNIDSYKQLDAGLTGRFLF